MVERLCYVVMEALQQMLSQQLLEQLMSAAPDPNGLPQPSPGEPRPGEPMLPDEIAVNDPRVQEILRRLPPETRQPIEDMIRQNNRRQSTELPRGPYPSGGRGTGGDPPRPLTAQGAGARANQRGLRRERAHTQNTHV